MHYAALTEELIRMMYENPNRFQEEQISATLRGEMAVMRLLGLNRNQHMQMAAGEISRQLGMTTSRIAAVLNSLEKKQLIVRRVDPKDRRRVMVSLTAEGIACHERKDARFRKHMTRFLELLGEKDARDFVRLMKRVIAITSSERFAEEESEESMGLPHPDGEASRERKLFEQDIPSRHDFPPKGGVL